MEQVPVASNSVTGGGAVHHVQLHLGPNWSGAIVGATCLRCKRRITNPRGSSCAWARRVAPRPLDKATTSCRREGASLGTNRFRNN